MTELKLGDVIKLKSDVDELNGFFLIEHVSKNDISLKKPPSEEYKLTVENGQIENVSEIVLVHRHPSDRRGYAELHGFFRNTLICITFDDDNEYCGVVKDLVEDMIEVHLDNEEIVYIDFEYDEKLPQGISSITLKSEVSLFEEEEEEFYLPESQYRYTLDKQLNDLMDKLLFTTKKTTFNIQLVNKIVQRFKNLRSLFTNSDGNPLVQHPDHVPAIQPHQVKWIVPVTNIARVLYQHTDETVDSIKELSLLQEDARPFTETYRQIFNQSLPFYPDRTGAETLHTMFTFIRNGKVMYGKSSSEDGTMRSKSVDWIPFVVNIPYEPLHTTVEQVPITSYLSFPDRIEYTRTTMPSTPLISKLNSKYMSPLSVKKGTSYKKISSCIPSISDALMATPEFFSIHQCIQGAEPYMVYKDDVHVQHLEHVIPILHKNIMQYKKKPKITPYVSTASTVINNPLYNVSNVTPSEQQVAFFAQDFGMLHIANIIKDIKYDQTHQLDAYIEKHENHDMGSTPPVIKTYASIGELKKDNSKKVERVAIYYDKENDTTDYTELTEFTTVESMRQYLVSHKNMSIEDANIYAPGFLKKKRAIVDGEYARVGKQFFQRVFNEWVLDETCTGPYPCASNEPACDKDCVDINFKLKQNLMTTILSDYKKGVSKTIESHERNLSENISRLTNRLAVLQKLNHANKMKYNDAKIKLYSSMSVINTSPNQSLLFYILQKPHREKYAELAKFISMHTRPYQQEENHDWLYCIITNLPLVPIEYGPLSTVNSVDDYKALIELYKSQNKITIQEDMYVLTKSGYPIGPKEYSITFDDSVRSDAVNERVIFELPRPTHPDTPIIIRLLVEICDMIRDATLYQYYNFIAHDIKKPSKTYGALCIAYVLKLTLHDSGSSLEHVLKKIERIQRILQKYELEEVITRESIVSSMQRVSGSDTIQKILFTRAKKQGELKNHTIWSTFLPPLTSGSVKQATSSMALSMNIMQILLDDVQSQESLIQDRGKVNTCKCDFSSVKLKHLVSQFKPRVYRKYNADIVLTPKLRNINMTEIKHALVNRAMFSVFLKMRNKMIEIQVNPESSIDDLKKAVFDKTNIKPTDQKILYLNKPLKEGLLADHQIESQSTLQLKEEPQDYGTLLGGLMKELSKTVNLKTMFRKDTPIHHLKTFIYNLGVVYPASLLNPKNNEIRITPTIDKVISGQHKFDLLKLMQQDFLHNIKVQYRDTDGLPLRQILQMADLQSMISDMGHYESKAEEFYYYLFTLMDAYLKEGELIRVKKFIQQCIDQFIEERDSIYLLQEDIKIKTVTLKVNEADEKRSTLTTMSSEQRKLALFLEEYNLSTEARLGRLQTYNRTAYTPIFTHEVDQGDDGNNDE